MARKSEGLGDHGHKLRQAVYPVITPSLVQFRRTLGKANFDFNTVRAGLIRLAQDQAPIEVDFAVTWNPHDLVSAVEEAQAYATNSLLVYAVDGVDAYMRSQASKPSALNGEGPRSIVRGEFQASAPRRPVSRSAIRELEAALWASGADQGAVLSEFREIYMGRSHRPGMRARFDELVANAGGIPAHYRAAIHILVSWRNRHVHGNADDHIDASVATDWLNGIEALSDANPHADGPGLLDRYRQNLNPTPDDITTLVALLHRTMASLDGRLLSRVDLDSYASEMLVSAFRALRSHASFDRHYWGHSAQGRARKLMELLLKSGFKRTVKPNNPAEYRLVPDEFWLSYVDLNRVQLYQKMGMTPPKIQ